MRSSRLDFFFFGKFILGIFFSKYEFACGIFVAQFASQNYVAGKTSYCVCTVVYTWLYANDKTKALHFDQQFDIAVDVEIQNKQLPKSFIAQFTKQ